MKDARPSMLMGYEGCSPQHVKKWGHYEDMAFYGILGDDFRKEQA